MVVATSSLAAKKPFVDFSGKTADIVFARNPLVVPSNHKWPLSLNNLPKKGSVEI